MGSVVMEWVNCENGTRDRAYLGVPVHGGDVRVELAEVEGGREQAASLPPRVPSAARGLSYFR